MEKQSSKPRIALSLGDPNGIGTEIVFKALKDSSIKKLAQWELFDGGESKSKKKMSPLEAGRQSYKALSQAVDSIKEKKCDALVTAPVSKTNLQLAGFPFAGQTEFLAHEFKAKKVAMMLASPQLKVVLVTIHIPLKSVFKYLSKESILEKIVLTHQSLKNDFLIKNPRIAVCGLNPHAGERGLFGDEEGDIIIPSIKLAKRRKINASGPYPPDTIFHQALLGHFDAVICHYHDQGLIPLKTLSFHEGVNTTLGLPIVRTSPDHGVAFDIAGKGIANPSSMKFAMRLAAQMIQNRIKSDLHK